MRSNQMCIRDRSPPNGTALNSVGAICGSVSPVLQTTTPLWISLDLSGSKIFRGRSLVVGPDRRRSCKQQLGCGPNRYPARRCPQTTPPGGVLQTTSLWCAGLPWLILQHEDPRPGAPRRIISALVRPDGFELLQHGVLPFGIRHIRTAGPAPFAFRIHYPVLG